MLYLGVIEPSDSPWIKLVVQKHPVILEWYILGRPGGPCCQMGVSPLSPPLYVCIGSKREPNLGHAALIHAPLPHFWKGAWCACSAVEAKAGVYTISVTPLPDQLTLGTTRPKAASICHI